MVECQRLSIRHSHTLHFLLSHVYATSQNGENPFFPLEKCRVRCANVFVIFDVVAVVIRCARGHNLFIEMCIIFN